MAISREFRELIQDLAERYPDEVLARISGELAKHGTEADKMAALVKFVQENPPGGEVAKLVERVVAPDASDVERLGLSVEEGVVGGGATQTRHKYHITLTGEKVNTKSRAYAEDMALRIKNASEQYGRDPVQMLKSVKGDRARKMVAEEMQGLSDLVEIPKAVSVAPKIEGGSKYIGTDPGKAIVLSNRGQGVMTSSGPPLGPRNRPGKEIVLRPRYPIQTTGGPGVMLPGDPPIGPRNRTVAQRLLGAATPSVEAAAAEGTATAVSGLGAEAVSLGSKAAKTAKAGLTGIKWLDGVLGPVLDSKIAKVGGRFVGPAFAALTAIQLAQLLEGSTSGLGEKQRVENYTDNSEGSQRLMNAGVLSSEENLNTTLRSISKRDSELGDFATRQGVVNQNTLDSLLETKRMNVAQMSQTYQPGPMEMMAAMRQLTGV